jgi:glycosyltransferase involved in cell wall biosynthesis
MQLSVIIATRNRMHAMPGCLDSIAASLAAAGLRDAEIVVVDNGSADDTAAAVVLAWARDRGISLQAVAERKPGLSHARNRGVRHAQGRLLLFTDDDCRLEPGYIGQLLAYDAADAGLVLRGGRVVLGNGSDLPLTVTPATRKTWSKASPPRHENIGTFILGCNMTMRRALFDRVGPFDERFGGGSAPIQCGEDHEYIFRAYCKGVTIATVPDMTVFHFHGRQSVDDGYRLMRNYMTGSGAIYAKYLFRSPNLCRQLYWDCKIAAKEIVTGSNLFLPDIGFSARDKLACYARGAARYFFTRSLQSQRQ